MLRLYFKGFHFTANFLFTLLFLFGLAVFISLGIWQLHRATEKEQILQQYEQRKVKITTNFQTINDEKSYQYTAINLHGKFDNAHNLLLDNRFYHHQFGYQLLTPFLPDNSQTWILVNRGWVAGAMDRKILPNIIPIQGEQNLTGLIYFPSKRAFVLSNQLESQQWPRIIEKIDISKLQQWLQHSFQTWTILLSTNVNDSLVRDWHPDIIPPSRNIGYAFQWFTFAVVLIIIFIAVNTKREQR